MYDKNGDRHISMSEVAVFIGDLGKSLNLTEAQALQRAIDTDGDGTVDLREFIHAWTPPIPDPVLREVIQYINIILDEV